MDLGINGKRALVFGGGGELGAAISCALADEGAMVFVADVSQRAAYATADRIQKRHGQARAVVFDLADLDSVDRQIAEIEASGGAIDILINNTLGPSPTPAARQSLDAWDDYFQSMVLSAVALTDRILPGMKQSKWGRIVTSIPSDAISKFSDLGISHTLRLSLLGWSRNLAREVGMDGVTCNIILSGRLATSHTELRELKGSSSAEPRSLDGIPLGRYGKPREYGDAVTFIASERASYITGTVLCVDGGLLQPENKNVSIGT
jgi:3-oxoacyl-[acyl-carrier protein] reductase